MKQSKTLHQPARQKTNKQTNKIYLTLDIGWGNGTLWRKNKTKQNKKQNKTKQKTKNKKKENLTHLWDLKTK